VLEKGVLRRTTDGTPQGGVISPLLSNIYLHYVLDEWFEKVARPRLKGRCLLVRYADDAVMAFEDHLSGKRMPELLGKRLGRYGASAPSDQDPLRRLPVQTSRWTSPCNGGDHVQLSRLHTCVGPITEGQERCPPDNGERPLRARTGFRGRVVQAKPALLVPGPACPPVAGDPGALRLLRHLGKRPTDQVVSPSARADMEEMARAARSPQQSAVAALPGHACAIPFAASQDRPPVQCRLSEAYA
jgi:Reverse transcriptase (RNA-dependent DNA polymerase)